MAELTYPNVANYNGVPLLLGTASVSDGKLFITFTPHKYSEQWTGEFLVKVTNPIDNPTTALPVFFNTQGGGNSYPLYRYNGTQATTALVNTTTGGIMKCVFDSAANRLQISAIV